MPGKKEWEWVGEGLARSINAVAVAATEAAGEALTSGPLVLGAMSDWLEVNGGEGALRTLRLVLDTAIEGMRR